MFWIKLENYENREVLNMDVLPLKVGNFGEIWAQKWVICIFVAVGKVQVLLTGSRILQIPGGY